MLPTDPSRVVPAQQAVERQPDGDGECDRVSTVLALNDGVSRLEKGVSRWGGPQVFGGGTEIAIFEARVPVNEALRVCDSENGGCACLCIRMLCMCECRHVWHTS